MPLSDPPRPQTPEERVATLIITVLLIALSSVAIIMAVFHPWTR